MSTKDATSNSGAGKVAYQPASPFESRACTVNFATFTVAASGADVVNVMPLAQGEFVQSLYLRIEGAGNASTTATLNDSRTGGGSLLAASAMDAAAGTVYKSVASGLGFSSNATQGAGFVQLTTVAAFALNTGSATVYAVIGKAF